MTITEYIAKHAGSFVTADIVERWNTRVVPQSMHTAGRAGAEDYLAKYGRTMKAPKTLGFACCAMANGHSEFANRMFEEAFFLETGSRPTVDGPRADVSHHELPTPIVSKPADKRPFGHYPQLLTLVDRPTAERMLQDPAFCIQEKVDGQRVMVEVKDGWVRAGNKRGIERPLPLNVAEALKGVCRDFVVDGELVGSTYHVFDLLELDGKCLRQQGFETRWIMLSAVVPLCAPCIKSVESGFTTGRKLELAAGLEAAGREGYVLKRAYAPYSPGEKHGTQFKFQFRALTACIVGERNGAKEAVEIFVLRADGSKRSMGFVTMIGHQIPAPGTVVEVENLYCHPGPDGKLAQAVFKGVRDDAVPADCREDKLRIKAA
jgi:bifunctional non-homologous end joining protein LigD